MKKLAMKLDDLQVESFSTHRGTSARQGAVQAHADPTDNQGEATDSAAGWMCNFTANYECMDTANIGCA